MIRNFLFHRVNPNRDPLWDPMDVKLFDRCIGFIRSKFDVVTIEDLLDDGSSTDQANVATIMFDDGYKDNIEYAADILDKYDCKASFYVVTDCIERNIPTWTYVLEHRFQHTQIPNIDLHFEFLPETLRVSRIVAETERINYVRRLKPVLKQLPHKQRKQVLQRVDETYSDVFLPEMMMDWNDLAELQNAGHVIGSHTVSHAMLATMSDEGEVRRELQESGSVIEGKLGAFPQTISYPVGSFNTTTKRLSKEAGYRIGLAVRQDVYLPGRDDIFEIPRIELYNEPWWKTKMRITHSLEKIKTMIGYR